VRALLLLCAALFCRHFIEAPLGGDAARAAVTPAACREDDGWQLDPIGTAGPVHFNPSKGSGRRGCPSLVACITLAATVRIGNSPE
jgi:hypothetical protein